jgi:hypothetical protein
VGRRGVALLLAELYGSVEGKETGQRAERQVGIGRPLVIAEPLISHSQRV